MEIAYEEHNEALLFDLWKSGDRSVSFIDFKEDLEEKMKLQNMGIDAKEQARLERLNSL